MYPTHYFNSVESTNITAKAMADTGAQSGAAIVAGAQTKGRGRFGRNWHSPAGRGLYCSIIVRPEIDPLDYPKITLAAGVAVAQVLQRYSGHYSQLKWPNDIYFSGKKCGGILTESSALNCDNTSRYAVVGIGLNINHKSVDFPKELCGQATSLLIESGREFTLDEIFQATRLELLQQLQIFARDGFAPILKAWRQRDFLLGKEMECVSSDGIIIRGVSQGINDAGILHIQDSRGLLHEVISGNVQLAAP